LAALAAAFSANFFFLSIAYFAFAISSSLFNSFSFAASTSLFFCNFSDTKISSATTLISGLRIVSVSESTSFSGATSGFSSRFLIQPSRLNSRLSRDGKFFFS
ncbi:hypothetical protein ERO13_D05G353332v2, partial [Gossypium hirsutum]